MAFNALVYFAIMNNPSSSQMRDYLYCAVLMGFYNAVKGDKKC